MYKWAMQLAGSWERFTQALGRARHAGTAGPDYPGTGRFGSRLGNARGCGFEDTETAVSGPEGVIRTALAAVAATPGVELRFEIACQPGVGFRGDEQSLRTVVMTMARHAAEAGADRVLVTCAHKTGRLRVVVTATGVPADPGAHEGPLRPVAELLALQGGGLEIAGRPGQGVVLAAFWPDWVSEQASQAPTGQAAEAKAEGAEQRVSGSAEVAHPR